MSLLLTAASWVAFIASGQSTPDTPEFEVASVKPADSRDQGPLAAFPGLAAEMGFDGGPGTDDPTRIRYHGISLKMLLARAYQVKPDQISGPSWLGSERYTIEAILPPGTNADRLRLMLQKLLVDRFQLSLHQEVKDRPVYRLKVAKNGPKLQPAQDLPHYESKEEQQEMMRKQVLENLARRKAAMEANTRNGIKNPGFRAFGLARASTEKFAEVLSGHLDRPVKDMTQLAGEYSFHLEWNPDEQSEGVSIYVAIQEQLGLKLEAGNEPIELLVIDKAEKVPISN